MKSLGNARWHAELGIACGYAALAVAATWPLVLQLDAALPRGSGSSATVPLVSAWTLWWNFDRLTHGFAGYWDAPIFYPTPGAFAFSEPMPLAGLVTAPLFALGATPAAAHNLFLLLALVLNGQLGFWLCRHLRLGRAPAVVAGASLVLLPYVHHQLGVLTLVSLAGVLATLLAVLRCARRPTAARGAVVALALTATYLLCEQYALLLALALLLSAPCLLVRRQFRADHLRALAALVATCALLVGPIAYSQRDAVSTFHFKRSVARATSGSAGTRTWWRTPWPDLVPLPALAVSSPPYKRALFPGTVRVGLALLGAAWGLRRRGRRRTTAFFVAVVASGFLLSLLPRIELGPFSPFRVARAVIPGLAQVRSLWRAGVLTQVALAPLLAQSLTALWGFAAMQRPAVRMQAMRLCVVALAVLAICELWPPRQALAPAPQPSGWQRWITWLHARVPSRTAMAILPFPRAGTVGDYEPTARFMYLQAFHGWPMVNGYSSYFAPSYDALLRHMRRRSASVDTDMLERAGAELLVVDRGADRATRIPTTWRAVFVDSALHIEAYEPAAAPAPASDGW